MKVLALSLIILSFHSCQAQKKIMEIIKVSHRGESDKPIRTLVISTEEIEEYKNDVTINVKVVSPKVFSTLKNFIRANTENYSNSIDNYEYGTFAISIISDSNSGLKYELSPKESKLYLEDMVQAIEGYASDKAVVDEINLILYRIM